MINLIPAGQYSYKFHVAFSSGIFSFNIFNKYIIYISTIGYPVSEALHFPISQQVYWMPVLNVYNNATLRNCFSLYPIINTIISFSFLYEDVSRLGLDTPSSVFKCLSNLFLQLFILLKSIPYRPGNGSGQQQQNKQRAYRCNLGCHNVVVRFEAEYNLMFAGRYAKGT